MADDAGLNQEEGDDDNLGAQLTVSTCWRSLTEASLVVGALARHLPLQGTVWYSRPADNP